MKKYLTEFSTYDDYKNFLRSGQFVEPNVSNIIQTSQQDETRPLVMYSPIEFFVYHTSDCTVEKIVIPKGSTFDITSVVREGYFYAGYFSAYGGAVSYDTDNPHEGHIEGDYTYDGSGAYFHDENNKVVRFFAKAKAYTQNGTEMHPNNNVTYFVRETPKEYTMKQHIQYLYNKDNLKITNLYNIFTIDDSYYQSVCTNVITHDNISTFRHSIYSSFTFGNTKITPETITGRAGGSIAVYDFNEENNTLPAANQVLIFENTAITLDGVDIHTYIKIHTNDLTKNTITAQYSDTMPSLD